MQIGIKSGKMNKQLLLLLAMAFGSIQLWAQSVVTGKVTDELGESLPGVNILVPGTAQGTVTDGDGNYSVDVPEGASLRYSFVGYLEQQLEVGDRSVINLALDPDVQQLGDRGAHGQGGLHHAGGDAPGKFVMEEANTLAQQIAVRLPANDHGEIAHKGLVNHQ